MSAGRILLVEGPQAAAELLERALAPAFAVERCREAALLPAQAAALRPSLVVLHGRLPDLSVHEARARLGAVAVQAPVAVALAAPSEAEVVRAVASGAVDVLTPPWDEGTVARLRALLDELSYPDVPGQSPPLQALLGVYRRSRRSGTLRLNAGTPFEGQAQFLDGQLVSAELGPVTGLPALDEMLWFQDGAWRFEGPPLDSSEPVTPAIPLPTVFQEDAPAQQLRGDAPVRLLFVDDDAELRTLYQARLSAAGFLVTLAEDGERGARAAIAELPDVVLADIDMPRLDGWGMLRKLKADHRSRELPLVFLSGRDDFRETLRAARAGAHDYLPKSWSPEQVVHRATALMAPRLAADISLQRGGPAAFELHVTGVQWLLRRMAARGLTGSLVASDDWGTYGLELQEGAPLSARSSLARPGQFADLGAVAALLVSRNARATFTPASAPRGPARLHLTMDALLAQVCETLNRLDARAVSHRLGGQADLDVDAELYGLFCRLATPAQLAVARAVCEERLPPAQLPERLGLTAEQVDAALRELLLRQVVFFSR